MKNFIKYAILWPMFIIGFLFFVKSPASAAEIIDIDQSTSTNAGSAWGMVFKPHFNNITRVAPFINYGTSTLGVYFLLCKGDARAYTEANLFTGTYPNRTDIHCKSGDQELVKRYYPNGLRSGMYGVKQVFYDFYKNEDNHNEAFEVTAGEYYYYL